MFSRIRINKKIAQVAVGVVLASGGVMAAATPASAALPPCCVAPWKKVKTIAAPKSECETQGLRGQNQRWWNHYHCSFSDWDIWNLYVIYS